MNGGSFSFKGKSVYVTRSGYTGEDGFEVSIANELAQIFCENIIDQCGCRYDWIRC